MEKIMRLSPSELIILVLVLLIPFISTNLTYDPTIIKTTAIKIGLILIFALYLVKSLVDNKKVNINSKPSLRTLAMQHQLLGVVSEGQSLRLLRYFTPLVFLFLLAVYLILNFTFKYPRASAEELFTAFLFFGFFLPWRTYFLALNLSRY